MGPERHGLDFGAERVLHGLPAVERHPAAVQHEPNLRTLRTSSPWPTLVYRRELTGADASHKPDLPILVRRRAQPLEGRLDRQRRRQAPLPPQVPAPRPPPGPARAIAFASGLGHFNLSCNGAAASPRVLDPGWTNYHRTVQFVVYDLSDRLVTLHLHINSCS